jgi:cation-transporting P-type ATPase D
MEGEEAWVDDQYYATDRENKCVVCGGKENFSRFHIVPTLYRTHFPDALKSHRSHDVLLLCFECHNRASRHQDVIKNELEKKYDSPLHQVSPYFDLNLTINQVRRSANSLLQKVNQGMPQDKA